MDEQEAVKELEEKMDEVSMLDELTLLDSLAAMSWDVTHGDAAAFESRLLSELAEAETQNVKALIAADEHISPLLLEFDKAVEELDGLYHWLESLKTELLKMGEGVQQIRSQNRGLQLQSTYQRALLNEIEDLLNSLEVEEQYLRILKEESLETPDGISRLEEAAGKLEKIMQMKMDDEIRGLGVIQERMDFFAQHANNLSVRLLNYLNVMISYQVETCANEAMKSGVHMKLQLSRRKALEVFMSRYRGLLLWMRELDPRNYAEIQLTYVQTVGKVNKQEIRQLFDVLQKGYVPKKPQEAFQYVLGPNWSVSNPAYSSANALDQAISRTLASIFNQVCYEQNFITDLFHIGSPDDFQRWRRQDRSKGFEDLEGIREPFNDLKVRKRLEELMLYLYDNLQAGLTNLCETGIRNDPTNAIAPLLTVETWVSECADSNQEFLCSILVNLKAYLSESFEGFITEQIRLIEDQKSGKRKNVGVLNEVRMFPCWGQFLAKRLEGALKAGAEGKSNDNARQTVDSAYSRLMKSIFALLDQVAREMDDDKDGVMKHVVHIENMNNIYTEIQAINAEALDSYVKFAKNSYDTNLQSYLQIMVSRPLGRLLDFFDGVEELVNNKSTADELNFHPQYNKGALRKLVVQFPGFDVKKGLQVLYKKVEKHFSDNQQLLQIVWNSLQEDVLKQIENINTIISNYYADAQAELEFTVDDIIGYFSEIAKNH